MVLVTLLKNVPTGADYPVEIARQVLEFVVSSSSLMAVQPSPKIALTFKTLDFPASTPQPLAWPTLSPNVLRMYVHCVWILKLLPFWVRVRLLRMHLILVKTLSPWRGLLDNPHLSSVEWILVNIVSYHSVWKSPKKVSFNILYFFSLCWHWTSNRCHRNHFFQLCHHCLNYPTMGSQSDTSSLLSK